MRKNNLIKSKKPNGVSANAARKRKSTPLKNPRPAKKTPLNGFVAPKTSGKNSISTDDLATKLNQAIKWFNEEKFEEAADLLEKTIVEYPNKAAVYWYLGWVYRDLGKTDRAIANFEKAVQLAPKKQRVSLGLFHALWDNDRLDEALEEMKRFQILTNGSCRDYVEILAEINEKWSDPVPVKKKTRAKK
jgi:tetratricopeptide (TPR) repeat protein